MSTSRTFQLDVDTKRYLARVNTYRKINGIGPVLPQDAADIDNFVVGLKDLGIWGDVVVFLNRSIHNIGLGSNISKLGGALGEVSASLISTPSWTPNGIQITATNQGVNTNVNPITTFGRSGYIMSVLLVPNTANEGRLILTCDHPATGYGIGMDDFATSTFRILNISDAIPKTTLSSNYGLVSIGRGIWGTRVFANSTSYINNTTLNVISTQTASNWGVGGAHLLGYPTGAAFPVVSKFQTNSLIIISGKELTFNLHLSMYNLLKTSVCKNLGLI
jgi:hypothetical protein